MLNTLFDTHAHFTGQDAEIRELLDRARESGVGYIMAVGGDETLNDGALRASKIDTGVKVFHAIGYDRDQAGRSDLPALEFAGAKAIGEIGLDYHYEGASAKAQCELFAAQLEKSRELDLPVVIHTREADDDTLGVLREIPSRGIIHSFTGSPQFCRRLLDLGFMISYSGIVTFRAADNVRESAIIVPDDRILIETDTPYLAPVPMRGKPNEPAFVAYTARFLADLRKTPLDAFAALATSNALSLLG